MRATSVLRWVAVVPAAILAWFLTLLVAVPLLALPVRGCLSSDGPKPMFCGWFPLGGRELAYFGAGLSAVVVVVVAAYIAPSHRRIVAWLVLLVGAAYAGLVGYVYGFATEALIAIACGVISAALVSRRERRTRENANASVVPDA